MWLQRLIELELDFEHTILYTYVYIFLCLQPWSGQLYCRAGLHDTDSTTHTLQCLLCKCPVFENDRFYFFFKNTLVLIMTLLEPILFFQDVGFVLVFSDIHLWASIFSVILVNYIFMDGKCDYFQGRFLFF